MRKIKKGDEVIVIAGRDKGKQSSVIKVFPDAGKVLVDGVNTVKKHTKPNPAKGIAGGILEKEMPIELSNIAIYNPHTKKADRVGIKVLEDGSKVRIYKSNDEVVDV